MNFNLHILISLREKKIKQYELARLTGISSSRLSNIIQGWGNPPTKSEVEAICRVLGLDSKKWRWGDE